ncbi:MAG: hypothetical protein K8I30_15135 [Anaerolineae bacterium]|nr:hypothetical protein [Anaerolineae bacterium]
MGFNRKDLEDNDDDFNFGDDDNSFDFGDEGGSDAGGFDFGDEPSDIGLDDDDAGFGFEDEDMPDIDDEEEAGGGGGGVSRTFIIIAAVMIILFLLGLGAVIIIGLGGQPKSDFELTSDAIIAMNATTAANALLTETAKAIDAGTQTAIALTPTVTPTLAPTDTPNIPTITPTPTLDETQSAANAQLTQQAADLTATAIFLLTPQATEIPQLGPNEVALTATELARILAPDNQPTTIAGAPTQEILTPGAPLPTQLPETGFFDDLATGNANVGMIALMALGLVGVIVVSRRVRTANK